MSIQLSEQVRQLVGIAKEQNDNTEALTRMVQALVGQVEDLKRRVYQLEETRKTLSLKQK